MEVDDRARLELYRWLEAVLGTEEAATLMAHLPPVTWQQVVTKDYLDDKLQVLDANVRTEIAGVRTDLHREINGQTWKLMTFMAGWSAALLTAVEFFGR